MKSKLTNLILALFVLTALAAVLWAEQQPQDVLGKIDFAELFDAAPPMPSNTLEAGKRTYGSDVTGTTSTENLGRFYQTFDQRVAVAHNIIKPAVDARPAHQEALAQRSVAQANNSPLISQMGGVEKMSQMSEAELQQAAAQAVGKYQQSQSGAPNNSSGMQAMMQRLMSDPAYQERFEKMTKKEQEAELQKYMGNAHAPTPPRETAAEKQAAHATNEVAGVTARQKELAVILQRMLETHEEFVKKDQAISATAGNHDQIARQINAIIEKIPFVDGGEAGSMRDPVKFEAALREKAKMDRNRAALELQQRTALFAERQAKYKEVASSYSAWLKAYLREPVSDPTAKLMYDSTADTALQCEEELINLAENLRKFNEESTMNAAQYEQEYQRRTSGSARPSVSENDKRAVKPTPK